MAFLKTVLSVRPARALRLRCAAWLLSAALSAMAGTVAFAQAPAPTEYNIKAVLLFNFAEFVGWPQRAFHDAKAPLVIGVLGGNPFGDYLDEVVKGEKIGEHTLVVRRYRRVEEIDDCHILFVDRSMADQLEPIFARLKGRSILTVGDADAFIRKGGMVRFVTENKKIRLRIDVEAAKASDLTISSKLLRAATVVTAEGDGP